MALLLTHIPTEWSQRDLVQAKSIKFCRQYLLFHDGASIVYAGPGGACCEINNEWVPTSPPPRVPVSLAVRG